MHQSVIEAWERFSTPLEGRVDAMYLDVKGLVTCAVGNLIDPIRLAEQLPWTLEDGTRADLAQVRADWHKLKDSAGFYAKMHWRYARAATLCRLTDAAIDDLVAQKRAEFFDHLKRHHFPALESFPADAQLGIMSMSWACGPGFPKTFGNFKRAVLAGDWVGAAASCKIRDGLDTPQKTDDNPGIVPRNKHNKFCFLNAARVLTNGIDDHHVLYWPELAPNAGEVEVFAKEASQRALDHFVAVERERFLERGPSAVNDLRDYDSYTSEDGVSDTDPSDLAPESNS
jgi:hypothetical protein